MLDQDVVGAALLHPGFGPDFTVWRLTINGDGLLRQEVQIWNGPDDEFRHEEVQLPAAEVGAILALAEQINRVDPSGRDSFGVLTTIGIGAGLLAGLTAASYLIILKAPSNRPGFWESLIPFWGSGKAYLYDLHNGNLVSAGVDGLFFVTDFFFLRSLVMGVAKLGWKEVIRPGTMRLMFGEWADGSFHAAWQIGDNVFHVLGNTQGTKWLIRVFKSSSLRMRFETQSAASFFGWFTEKVGFSVPVLSRGLGQLATSKIDCLTALLQAVHRANYGILERVIKAAVIQGAGLTQADLQDPEHQLFDPDQ
jgi:hypothetical protein